MPVKPQVVWMPGGVRTEIHLVSKDTDGAFCLLVDHSPPGWSLPAHLHRGVAETIHVVEGEFEMEIDGQRSRLSAGETIHVPADVAHSGGNVGEAWGRRIVMFSPAGMEQFFRDAGAPSEDAEVEPTAALAVAVRHGWKFTSELLTERGLELSAEGRPQLVRACTSSIPGLTCRGV